MPKRDAAYMEDQRATILQATLDCMIDIGIAATSMRAIAQRAGVTTGAVYTHFESREELIIAASNTEIMYSLDPVESWRAFAGVLTNVIEQVSTDPRYRKIQRAMYEFVATVDMTDRFIPALDKHMADITRFVAVSLSTMHARGEVSLPLGLDMSTRVLHQLLGGAVLSLFSMPNVTAAEVNETMIAAITHVVGLVNE